MRIRSFFCLDHLIQNLKRRKIEPVVDLIAINSLISVFSNPETNSRVSRLYNSSRISEFWGHKDCSSLDNSNSEDAEESVKIIKLLLESSCILKYGDKSEDILDILKSSYLSKCNKSKLKNNFNQSVNSFYSCKLLNEEVKLRDQEILDFEDSLSFSNESRKDSVNWDFEPQPDSTKFIKFDTTKLDKMNTLRVCKIKEILTTNVKAQGLNFTDLHILNMKESKNKYLQHKDIVEISLIFGLFDAVQVAQLCTLIYFQDQTEYSSQNFKYPVGLYKLMVFYEELQGFHMLLKQEDQEHKHTIVTECFSYSLVTCSPLTAVYLRNKYPEELFDNKSVTIDSILHYLNGFTDCNSGVQYKRVVHLEQYLYLVESMLSFFTFQQAKYFYNIVEDLIKVGDVDFSKLLKIRKLNRDSKHRSLDAYQNNFMVYSLSPVKECVLLLSICKKLEDTHEELQLMNEDVFKKYSRIVSSIFDEADTLNEVYLTLTDKCFNQKEVIDIICHCDLQIVLNNEKVARVIVDFWDGPFETEFFLNSSAVYQKVYGMFLSKRKFLDYHPKTKHQYSVTNLVCKRKKSEPDGAIKPKLRKAHFFHYERWNKSLITKYMVEVFFILVIMYHIYTLVDDGLEQNINQSNLGIIMEEKANSLNIIQPSDSEYIGVLAS